MSNRKPKGSLLENASPEWAPMLEDRKFFLSRRLVELAALAAKVQGTRIDRGRAPKGVMTAIRELNEIAILAAGTRLGLDRADRLFQERLAGTGRQERLGVPGQRSKAIVAALDGHRGLVGKNRPCGEPLARAEEVLQAAFSLDVREGNRQPNWTYQAAAYMQGRMRAVAQFEGGLWREAGGRATGSRGEVGGGRPGHGGPVDPLGGPEGPSEPILPPDLPLPDPPPDPGGPGSVDPGLCEHLGELCIALYEEAAAALLGDPFIDLIASVDPGCVCHDYDPNQIFVGRPAQGREFPVPLPPDVRLIFRGTDITANIIQPVMPQELRFTIPPNSRTGYVYLRGLFQAERTGVPHPERLCGMSMPDFPTVPMQGPAALISIVFPPIIDTLTADGHPGPVVVVQACHAIDVCWHVHLADQAPHLPLPPGARIEVVVRNEAGHVVHEGGRGGCISVAGKDDQTLTVEARSFADDHECGRTDPTPITLERVARVTLIRNVPQEEELIAGTNGSFFVEISCPAPAAGVEVRLWSSVPVALRFPANVVIPGGQARVQVDFTTAAEARGRVDVRAFAAGHEEAWLTYDLVPSPAEVCRSFEDLSVPWSKEDVPWANWGVIDSADTFLGFLPTPLLFRPTTQFEIAQAIRRAEADRQTIRALGSGWSFSEAVLPQSSAIQGPEQVFAGPLRVFAQSGLFNEETLHNLASNFKSHFGYAIDTSGLDRNLRILLPDILADGMDPASFFFVEAGMTINFLNTLLDSQTPRVALRTMGGASGQTVAGAISTGTHGGDFDRPPLADAVRAIYLIAAGGVHHWIEPANPITDPRKLTMVYPCLADHIHYDDDMFRAVLVSMGAMGVIYAVILDVVPQYSLLQWNKWSTWETLKAEAGPDFATLFDGTWTGMRGFLEQRPGPLHPPNRFAQVVINPIRNDDGSHNCFVSNRVQLPLQERSGVTPLIDYTKIPRSEIENAIANDPNAGLHELINLRHHGPAATGDDVKDLENLLRFCKSNNYPWAVRAVINRVMQKTFPEPGDPPDPQIDVGYKVMAPGGENRAFPPLGGTSVEAAFSFFRTVPALDQPPLQVVVPDVITFTDSVLAAFDQGVNSEGKVFPAGWFSLRVTGRTAALLGMQRFQPTGMVEVSLIGRPDGYGLVQFVEQIARNQGGALHWGQSNGMMSFLDLEFTYGNSRINKWKTAQRALGGDTFTNLFMRRCGLA